MKRIVKKIKRPIFFMRAVLFAIVLGAMPLSADMTATEFASFRTSVKTSFCTGAGLASAFVGLLYLLEYKKETARFSKINKEVNEQESMGCLQQLTYGVPSVANVHIQRLEAPVVQAVRNYNFAIQRPIESADYASNIQSKRTSLRNALNERQSCVRSAFLVEGSLAALWGGAFYGLFSVGVWQAGSWAKQAFTKLAGWAGSKI